MQGIIFTIILSIIIGFFASGRNNYKIYEGTSDGNYFIENHVIKKNLTKKNLKKLLRHGDNNRNKFLDNNINEINFENKTISINYYKATIKIIYNNDKYCNLTIDRILNYDNMIKEINKYNNKQYVYLCKLPNVNICCESYKYKFLRY